MGNTIFTSPNGDGVAFYVVIRGGRYTIGRREKSGRKYREEGENEMLWE